MNKYIELFSTYNRCIVSVLKERIFKVSIKKFEDKKYSVNVFYESTVNNQKTTDCIEQEFNDVDAALDRYNEILDKLDDKPKNIDDPMICSTADLLDYFG